MQNWDPLKHTITVGGHTVVGISDGTFITAAFNEDQWSIEVGADGTVTRIRNANRTGRFTIVTKKSSPSNTYLASLAKLDYASGQGVVPVMVKDNNNTAGRAKATGEQCWIVKMADYERQKALGDQTWIIETSQLDLDPSGITNLTQGIPNIPTPTT